MTEQERIYWVADASHFEGVFTGDVLAVARDLRKVERLGEGEVEFLARLFESSKNPDWMFDYVLVLKRRRGRPRSPDLGEHYFKILDELEAIRKTIPKMDAAVQIMARNRNKSVSYMYALIRSARSHSKNYKRKK